MKVIKKINNNVVVCLDNNGHELIAFGKGLGFQKTPYELTDLSLITRTFYGANSQYYALLDEIPGVVFEVSAKIVDYAKTEIKADFTPNLVFTLADHINFAIERYKKNISIKYPLAYDLESYYEKEMEISRKAVKLIESAFNVKIPEGEESSIAIHLINAEGSNENLQKVSETDKMIADITRIIETHFGQPINKKTFNYSRFATHVQYLLKRREDQQSISSENSEMFASFKGKYPRTYQCVLEISEYFKRELNWETSEEELLYLMIHINRMCSREDCNQ